MKISNSEILILILVVLIVGMTIVGCRDNFRGIISEVSPSIKKNFYAHIYFSNIINLDTDNVYFLANKKFRDNRNLYFMNHNTQVVSKKKLKPNEIEKTKDKDIQDLAFLVKFNNVGGKSNLMSFFKIQNLSNVKNERIKDEIKSKTLNASNRLNLLQNVFFLRNDINNPKKGFKIVKQMAGNTENQYLEIDYQTKTYKFKPGYQLSEQFKHTFYLIPYFCPSRLNSALFDRGPSCIWKTEL